jgi:hypothetical protein
MGGKMTFGKIALFLFALEALAFPAIVAQSAPKVTAYPERPIRVLFPFAPGWSDGHRRAHG